MNFKTPPVPVKAAKFSEARTFSDVRPLHPFLRAVALVLVFALTLAGPAPQMALASDVSVYLDDTNTAPGAESPVTLSSQNPSNLVTIQPGSGTLTFGQNLGLFTLYQAGSFTASSLGFSQPDGSYTLNGMTVISNSLQLTLGAGGFSLPYGIKLTQTNIKDLSFKLAASQTWNLSPGDAVEPASGQLAYWDPDSGSVVYIPTDKTVALRYFPTMGSASQTVRVDSSDGNKKTLTLNINGSGLNESGGDAFSEAFLDVGANIDVEKNGMGKLTLGVYDATAPLSAFNGTIGVNAGSLTLQDGFLLASGTSLVGPQLKFNYDAINLDASTIGRVQISGSNAVTNIIGGFGIITSEPSLGSGTLTLAVASGGYASVSAKFQDGDSAGNSFLSLRKVGGGLLEILAPESGLDQFAPASDFSGGTTLVEGTLRLTYSTSNNPDDGVLASGPLGTGALKILGGTLNIGVSSGSLLLSNNVNFGVADSGALVAPSKIRATINGAGGLFLKSAATSMGDTVITLNADTVLTVSAPTVILSDVVSNASTYATLDLSPFKLIKDGNSTLTLLKPLDVADGFGADFTLRQGTLDLQRSLFSGGTTLTVDSDRDGISRVLKAGTGATTSGIASIKLGADFSYSSVTGANQKTLNLSLADGGESLSQTTVGGGEYAYGRVVAGRVTITVDAGSLILGDVVSNSASTVSGMEAWATSGSNTVVAAGSAFLAGMVLNGTGVTGRMVMGTESLTAAADGYAVGNSLTVGGASGFVPGMLLSGGSLAGGTTIFVRSVTSLPTKRVSVVSDDVTSQTVTVADVTGLQPGMLVTSEDGISVATITDINVSLKTLTLSGIGITSGQTVTITGSVLGLSGAFAGGGLVTSLQGAATSLVLDGNATATGNYTLGGDLGRAMLGKAGNGSLQIAGTLDVAGLNMAGGSLLFSSSTPVVYGGTMAVVGSSTLSVLGTSLELAGTLTGSSSLTKIGTGKLTLSHSNPLYSGSIFVSAGTLAAGATQAFGAAPVITLASVSGVRLQLNGNDISATIIPQSTTDTNVVFENAGTSDATLTINGALTFKGKIQDGGAGKLSIAKIGSGSLVLTGTANTYTGTTSVTGGSLFVGIANLGGANTNNISALVVGGTGYAQVTSSGTLGAVTNSSALSSGGTSLYFSANSGTITLSSLAGTGRTLFANNAWFTAGGISAGSVSIGGSLYGNVSGGAVSVGGAATLNTVSGGTLALNGVSSSITNLNGGQIALGLNHVLSVSQGTTSGIISGNGSLIKTSSGQLTLTGANTYTGTTSINEGTLSLGGNGYLAGPIAAASGATLQFNGSSDQAFSGALSGSGALVKDGAKIATFSSATGFSGNATVNAGTLAFVGGTGSNAINLASAAASVLFSSGDYAYNGTVSGSGITYLSGTADSPLSLTLGGSTKLGSNIKIGNYATLTLGSAANFDGSFTVDGGTLVFGGAFNNSAVSLTINTGQVRLNGNSQTLGSITLNGGQILNNGAAALLTADAITTGATSLENTRVVPPTKVEFTDNTSQGLRLTAGSLQNLASGTLANGGIYMMVGGVSNTLVTGTYQTVEAQAAQANATLYFDQAVVASGSVLATMKNATSPYTLEIQAPVTAPLMDVQNGVNARFVSGGIFSSGTLQIEGSVNLSGGPKTILNIALLGGTLSGDSTAPLTFTGLNATSGLLSATLAGSGSISQTGNGLLIVSGNSAGYAGSLTVNAGTVRLGNVYALGDAGKVTIGSSATLQLSGTSLTLASLQGNGSVENGSGAQSILTLNPTANSILSATLRDGTGGNNLQFIKTGSQVLTIAGSQQYSGQTTVMQGSLVLATGAQLYAGVSSTKTMTLSGGTLDLGGNSQAFSVFELNSGAVRNGTLNVSTTYTLKSGVVDASLGGSGSVTVDSAGKVVTINSTSTYTGTTLIANGTLSLGLNGTLGSAGQVTVSGGSLDLGASKQTLTNVALTGGVISGGSISSSTLFNLQNGTTGTVLGGAAKLTKTGLGSVVLTVANEYTGGTEVSAGLLTAAVDGALPAGGALTVAPGGTLELGTTAQAPGFVTIQGGVLSGGALTATGYSLAGTAGSSASITTELKGALAQLTVSGGGITTLNKTASYGGGTVVTGGTLALGVNNALLSTGALNVSGGELSMGSTTQTVGIFTLGGGQLTGTGSLRASAFVLNDGIVNAVLTGSGSLNKTGTGSVTLTGGNSYTGNTQVSGGLLNAGLGALAQSGSLWIGGGTLAAADIKSGATLTLAGAGAKASFWAAGANVGTVSNANTAFDSLLFSATNGTVTVDSITGAGATHFGSNAVITNGGVSNGDVTVDGFLTTGAVTGGSVTVGGVATVKTVTGGTLALNGATSSITTFGGDSSVRVKLGNGNQLSVGNGSMQGQISGNGSLLKTGSDVLTIAGNNTYSGSTTLRTGTLRVTGSLGSGALVLGDNATSGSDAVTALFGSNNATPVTIAAGAVTLGGTNTTGVVSFSGPTSLSAANGYSVVLQAANGGVVDFTGAWTTNNKSVTIGSAGNAGTIRFSTPFVSAGALFVTNGSTLLAGVDNAWSGDVSVTGSSLSLGAFKTGAGRLTLADSALLGTGTITASSYEASGNSTIAAFLGGSGSFTKSGAGTLGISSASTGYTGVLNATQGTVEFTGTGVVGGAIANGGTLLFNNTSDVSVTGGVSGAGSLIKNGSNVLRLQGVSTFTGATTVNQGSLVVAGTLASGTILNNGNVVFNLNAGTATLPGSFEGTGNIYLSPGNPSLSSVLASDGSWKFGSLAINSGVMLKFGTLAWAKSGTITLIGGALDTYGSAIDPSKVVIDPVTPGNVRLRINSAVTPVAGENVYTVDRYYTAVFMENGGLQSGTLKVVGGVDLDGNTKSFGLISLAGGSIDNGVLSGGTLTSTGGRLSATLGAGFGSVTKTGAGVLTVSGNNTDYAGLFSLQEGTLVTGNSAALGSGAATLSFDGNGSSSILRVNGNSVVLGSLSVTGAASGIVENGLANTLGTLTLSPAGSVTYSGTLRNGDAGTLAFAVNGPGSVLLNGNLTHTGGTTVQQGLLVVDSDLAATGAVTAAGGTFDLNGRSQNVGVVRLTGGSFVNGVLTGTTFEVERGQVDATLAGTADFTKTTTGIVLLTAANTLSGKFSVLGGTLQLADYGNLSSGSLVVKGAGSSVDLGGSNQSVGVVSLSDGTIGNGGLTGTSFELESGLVSAQLNGSGTLVKTGSGMLTLSGANMLSGLVDIREGSLSVSGSGLLSTGSLSLSGGASLNLGDTTQTVGAVVLNSGRIQGGSLESTADFSLVSGTVDASLTGDGTLVKNGASGTVSLNATNFYTGGTTLKDGTLVLSARNALGSGSLQVDGGLLALGASEQNVDILYVNSGALSGTTGTLSATEFNVAAGTVGAVLVGSGTFTKTGVGSATLSRANRLDGLMVLQGGELLLNGDGSLTSGSLRLANGAVLDLGGVTRSTGTVTLDSGIVRNGVLAGAQYDLREGTVSAVLAGAQDATKSGNGTVVLSGANQLSGTVFVNGGTLALANTRALALASVNLGGGNLLFSQINAATLRSLTGNLALENSNGQAVTLTLDNGSADTYSQVLSGAGSLTKAGSGELTLNGVNTFTGVTTVAAGTLSTTAGALNTTSAVVVTGGLFNAVDFNTNASLNVGGSGVAAISGSGLVFAGSVTNTSTAANGVLFSANSGTITIGSLYGEGSTRFVHDAVIASGSIGKGVVSVGGALRANISGGQVSAGVLSSQLVSGGSVNVAGVADVATVSGGVLTLNGDTSSIATLNGGGLVLGANTELTVLRGSSAGTIRGGGSLVKSGSDALALNGANSFTGVTRVEGGLLSTEQGALGATSRITVNGGKLSAYDYNGSANLGVGAQGTAEIRGSGLTLSGVLTNGSTADAGVVFSATTGTITLGSLQGTGATRFASGAKILGAGILGGSVSAAGLLEASIAGGRVDAASLRSASISGGVVRVAGAATMENVSGGTLALNGASSSINGVLTGGDIALGGTGAIANTLTVYSGNSAGLISGTGTLVKSGSGTLSLSAGLGANVALRVDAGSLQAYNVLSDTRSITVGSGGTLGVKLAAGTTTFNGTSLTNSGSVVLLGSETGSRLQVSSNSALLDGNFTLGNRLTLDVSAPTTNIFGESANLTLLGGGSLYVGGPDQELTLLGLNISGPGTFTITGSGGKILFDELPAFVTQNPQTLSGSLVVSGVTFDYTSKGGPVDGLPGVFQFSAGAVKDKTGTSTVNGIFTGTVLRLEPQAAKTVISLTRQSVNFSSEIIAGGSEGFGTISIGTLAYTPLLTIKPGVSVLLDNRGRLMAGLAEGSAASRIVDSGTLVAMASTGDKEIANTISGDGILVKAGSAAIKFSGDNGAFTGVTQLKDGLFVAGSKTALGSSSLNFNGGSLSFESGLGAVSISGAVRLNAAALVDTQNNAVTLSGNLAGQSALTKLGSGKLVLAGDNTQYSGDIAVGAGVLQIGDGGSGGALSATTNIQVAGGTIMRLARAATTTLAQSISGAGTLEQAGLGTTVLSGNNAGFTGKVVLGAGTLNLGSAQALGGSTDSRIVFNGGVLQFSENNNTDYSSRFSSEDGQTLKIDTNGRNVAFGATLTGDATSLVKIGKGELVLSGANNTYGGGTTVQSGTLRLVGVQKGAGTIAVNSGKLVYELTSGTVAANITTAADTLTVVSVASGSPVMSGSVSGAGAFVKQGAGSLTMTRSMLQTGGFTLNGGTFNLATPAGATEKISMGGAVVLNEGTLNIAGGVFKLGSTLAGGSLATLQLGADTVFLKSVALNALNIQIPDGTSNLTVFTDETPILTSHTMISGGTVVFKKFDPTTISAQDLAGNVQNPSVMSNLSFDGKSSVNFVNSLSLNGDLQTAPGAKITFGRDITIAGAVQLSGGSVRVTGGTLRALSAPISIGASGAAASLELSGSNTAVVAPKVQLTSGSISVAGDALSTALQGVQTLEVGTSNGTAGAAQLILGGGTGTMTLGAAQTLKGSGTIVGNISLKDESSTLSPGNSPGKITIAGSLDLQGGTLRIEIGKTARDQIDMQGQRVTVGTSASLLIVDAENGALSAGSTLSDIFIGGTLAGNFSPDRIYFMRQTGGQDIFSAMFTASGSLSALTITRNLFANTKGLSYNVRGVATALDTRIIKGKASNESLMELGTGSSIAEASARVSLQLAAANPAAYAELASLSKQRILTLNQELANHFSSLRAGLVDAPEGPYNFWTTGYGTWHKQNADPSMGNAGFSGNTYGDMFGVEKRVGDMVVGVTGAAGSTSANFSALAGRVSTDSWHAGAYAAAALSGYSLESGLVFGSTDSTAYRTIVAPGMNGGVAREGKIRFGGSEWLAHLGVAKPFVSSGSFTVTPSVRLIAAGNVLDSSTESSLDGLEVKTNAQTTYSILQEMGVEARRNLKLVSRPSAVSLRVDWIHDYCNKGRALDMDIAGDSASRFGYKGSDAGADALHLGAGLETAITRRTTLRVSLDYQAQSNASTTRGFLSLGYNF